MLGNIRKDIERLVAAYEVEKGRRKILEEELQKCKEREEIYRKQIDKLEKQIDNLKLKNAFLTASGENSEAKTRIERMIHEIDRCISLIKR